MNNGFRLDTQKMIAAIKFIATHNGESIDIFTLSKILYFADQKHLAKYGRPIVGDEYAPMPKGPVPSHIFDIVKSLRGEASPELGEPYKEHFEVEERIHITPKSEPNIEDLSESDIECLLESIKENKDLRFPVLSAKSHDAAYEKASFRISFIEMAKCAGASEDTIEYIKTNIENSRAVYK